MMARLLALLALSALLVSYTARGSCRCGIKPKGKSNTVNRIITGTGADHKDWPWIVKIGGVIGVGKDTGKEQVCGGTLLSSQWVLTAAHCVTQMKYLDVTVLGNRPRRVEKANWFAHEKFNKHNNKQHDIALVYLKGKLEHTPTPACLPAQLGRQGKQKSWVGSNASVYGWGRVKASKGSPVSEQLMITEVKIIDKEDKECKKYSSSSSPGAWTKDKLCAFKKGTRTCSGDSGGPLTVRQNGRHYLAGVVSYGNGRDCDKEGWADIYSDVSYHRSWIASKMSKKPKTSICTP